MNRVLDGETLSLTQERRGARVSVNEQGSVLVTLPIRETRGGMLELIEEFLQQQIGAALAFSSWMLDRIDPTQRLAHLAIAADLANADYMGWRTQREHDASPNSLSIGKGFAGGGDRSPVFVSRPRAALRLDAVHNMEDLLVPLRRQWR